MREPRENSHNYFSCAAPHLNFSAYYAMTINSVQVDGDGDRVLEF